MRRSLFALTAVAALALSACSDDTTDESTTGEGSGETGDIVTLKVGASPVPHADILNFINDNLAEEAGISIEVVEYSDYVLPNRNLDEGELDANFFQHVPYFEEEVANNGYEFEHGEGVHIEPYAVYSETLDSLDDVEDGAQVSIVNDPSNQARALWLLEDEGLLTVDPDVDSPTILDITDNPKNLEFVEIEAPNLVRTLADVDLSIINGNFALEGGLVPSEDALAIESGEDNPYANVLAWKTDTDKADAIATLDELLHSPEVADYITENWPNGEVVPAFEN